MVERLERGQSWGDEWAERRLAGDEDREDEHGDSGSETSVGKEARDGSVAQKAPKITES